MVNNQFALILGGTTGLGFASVKKLAAEGFNIIVAVSYTHLTLPTSDLV